ncbi:conserved hypothetical protein [Burkholderia mallei PRL-20]|uniref:Uncharacterized protein n=2 Tax=Burkholderia pseudomallei TaxID=28450 RepID=A0A0E1VTU7_BURPE|nr:hypothetical protein BMASAVP1_0839 [Burkholderia mallei SAVP1]ABN92726.1 hypothetical protein BURPS1106A_A0332 [Burkholderia pseudomallei 1106a]ABO03138.1 hypothetical protein BMA10247_A2103 [Burkholderia mallei NCTC 10247]EEC33928.1 conserved hypothetical protein [Burkholderia pseudomallei 576]EEH29154.1 conserved hypothetical protein [Burkholderia pseudomallei Pakistan 9]EEP52021.1 conserved hypothetical protein [Burkholderia pseudomallei MSHR346]EEP87477.1 conserved hypothetical protein
MRHLTRNERRVTYGRLQRVNRRRGGAGHRRRRRLSVIRREVASR